jgi:Ca2+-binding EF-hand superfamily protein
MAHENYTQDELNALKGIFSLYDPDKTGSMSVNELEVRFGIDVI